MNRHLSVLFNRIAASVLNDLVLSNLPSVAVPNYHAAL